MSHPERAADALATALNHPSYTPPAGFAAVPVPVHKGSTVLFPSVAALRRTQWVDKSGYTYGLHGHPPPTCWSSSWPRSKARGTCCSHPAA